MHEKQLLPTILLTHYGNNWIRGSERCLLDLIANIDRKKFRIVLWCNSQIVGKAALNNQYKTHLQLTVLMLVKIVKKVKLIMNVLTPDVHHQIVMTRHLHFVIQHLIVMICVTLHVFVMVG